MSPLTRYFFNLLKVENRKLATQCGGHPEVPTSARIGYMRDRFGYWWTGPACKLLSWWFNQPDHCSKALAAEDDDMTKYVSDPQGKYFIPLLSYWLLWRLFALYCILQTVGLIDYLAQVITSWEF